MTEILSVMYSNDYEKLDSFETCTVVDCKSCNMGKWIIQCENEQKDFTKVKEWSLLKQNHELVHNKVQQYINENASKSANQTLRKTASEIEAYNAYKTAKESFIKELANKWKGQIDERAYEALMNYKVEITD